MVIKETDFVANFDKKYYDDIWGTVHRHDYCMPLAQQLVAKYGKVSMLDIGTGCGYLVRCLRELGSDAWGVEISDYALLNKCDEHVLKGDIRNLPFASNRFEVIHSQGVWGYFPLEEVQKAWNECKRVGKYQYHNIDYNDTEPTHQYLFTKSKEWWDNQFYPKILVACPNHEVKEYAFQRWIDNVKTLTYPRYDILVVDNSPNSSNFSDKWGNQITIKHIDTEGIESLMILRLNLSYEFIRKEFLAGDYSRLMIIESDVIPPKDIIEKLLELGKDTDWISHAYPQRNGDGSDAEQGIGCSLFTRRLMETFEFESLADNYSSDGGLWMKVRPDGRFTTMELWNYWKNQHLNK